MPLRVVGIGASAGGLDAIRELLEHLAPDTGMAFVFIQHLAQDQKSALAEILARSTAMPVIEVLGDTPVVADRVYVMPSVADMSLRHGVLRLITRPRSGSHLPVDRLFRSLAEESGERAIGVILSGVDSDGTEGAKAIKAAGGIMFAQDESARFDGMPRHAAAEGVIDYRLAPAAIGGKLTAIASGSERDPPHDDGDPEELEAILALLLGSHGVDLQLYKTPTIHRRIQRRMGLVRAHDLASYRHRLESDAAEREALYDDVLIGVTRFFREPEKIAAIAKTVLPALAGAVVPEEGLRVWVPGCSTGEQAYSIAIAIAEFLDEQALSLRVQVFATDINHDSIAGARTGRYPQTIEADVSAKRLERFFLRERGGYMVNKAIRAMCVFATHDLLRDPPFGHLHLVCCSNVLIYLQPVQQQRIIDTFAYALEPGGFLMLGPSESLGSGASGFVLRDRKQKIFQLDGRVPRLDLTPRPTYRPPLRGPSALRSAALPSSTDAAQQADGALLARFSPPCLLLNDALEVIELRGTVQRFLRFSRSAPTFELRSLLHEGLLTDVTIAIDAARRSDTPIRLPPLTLPIAEETVSVAIEVFRLEAASGRHFLVVFDGSPAVLQPADADTDAEPQSSVRLRTELASTKDYLRRLSNEHEAADADLRAASEELQSTNEELQSTNEELETAKEELQSTNEELTTLNDELRTRNADLIDLGDDLMNLLGGIDTPVIMVDRQLMVRRFNPTAQKLLSLLGTDLGRPIYAFKPLLDVPGFTDIIQQVIDTNAAVEHDVQDHAGRWYSLRVRPYRTARNEINGAVITLVDTHELRTLLEEARMARHAAEDAQAFAEVARGTALDANRVKDEFLSTLSHELRTPITSVLGWAQMMRMVPLDEPTLATAISTIERATKTQIRLIDDLLDVSRITSGRLRIEQRVLDFGLLVAETLDVIRPAAEAKGVRIEAEALEEGVVIFADADRLRQVVWNLLINAVKFTPLDGSIVIALARGEANACLTVRDTGEGIAADFLPMMFDRFAQGESGNKRGRGGLGLGLAIARYMVELHGGRIAAESPGAGQGSTFTVTLPLYASGASSGSAPAPETEDAALPSLDGLRVLVVDDDPDTRTFIATALEKCGASVTAAASAAEAIAHLGREHPDILISDIARPGEDGVDLIRIIREHGGADSQVPAIALTAFTSPQERERILAAGFQKFLAKPASFFDVARSVAELAKRD